MVKYFFILTLNSEIFEINKIAKKEKDNSEFSSLIECLKKSKKRHSGQGILNSTIDCIQDF
jgi:hypothetical protein